MIFLRANGERNQREERRDHPHGSLAGRTRAGKSRKCGYLDAPVPKEKPPPVAVPPGATVVEPSVLVPKENPVDMAAGDSAPSASRKGSGTLFTPQSRGGPRSIPLTLLRPGRNPKPQRQRRQGLGGAEQPLKSTFRRWPRARNGPEAGSPRRERWDGEGRVRRAKHPGKAGFVRGLVCLGLGP